MGIEIIERIGGKVNKETYGNYKRSQVSFNSDGRVVVRLVLNGENEDESSDDIVLVLGQDISDILIKFCQKELKEKREPLPF